jgi:hypothetical protein
VLTRRSVVAGATASVAVPLAGCAGGTEAYDAEARRIRAPLKTGAPLSEALRYATLAANSHNTQPWRFALGGDQVTFLPDLARRLRAVDPDNHHLFASLGCAAENFALAAAALGRPAETTFEDAGDGRVVVDLDHGPEIANDLFRAIPDRQCTRSVYDGRAVATEDLRLLEQAASVDGVDLILITEEAGIDRVVEAVVAANSVQMDDPAFIEELEAWIRFNPTAALATRDGLFSGSSGNPSLPTWLARLIFPFVFTKRGENEKYAAQIRSSAGIAVFASEADDRKHWVAAGRSYQRFALQATALGIRHAHINQPVEVASLRGAFAKELGIEGRRPDLVVRFGYAAPLPMSLRRPVDAVTTA